MAKQVINIGASANDGSGDPLRNAFDKSNDNFNELYFAMGGNTPVTLFDGSGNLNLLGKPHKVSFYYADEATILALSASTYKGCIAQADDTGYMYYSDGSNWIKLAKFSELASAGSSANTFGTIAVSGQSSVVADGSTDTLTLVAGANITLTTDANADSITIAASGGGGSSFANSDIDAHLNTSAAGNAEVLSWNGSDYEWVAQSAGGSSFANTDVDAHLNTSGAANNEVLSWDGSDYAWISVGGGSGYTDADVNAHLNQSSASSGEVLSWNGSDYAWVAQSGGSSFANSDVDAHLNVSAAANTEVLSWNGSDYEWVAQASSGSLSRTQQGVAQTIADGATENIEFSGLGKTYTLFKVVTTAASWIRIYSDTASRTADAGRTQGSDPAEGAGIIAEFIATGATTFKVTPGLIGWVDNSETVIPVAVTNLSGASASITTTLVGIPLET